MGCPGVLSVYVVGGRWLMVVEKSGRQSRGTARPVKTRGIEICFGLLVSSILISLTAVMVVVVMVMVQLPSLFLLVESGGILCPSDRVAQFALHKFHPVLHVRNRHSADSALGFWGWGVHSSLQHWWAVVLVVDFRAYPRQEIPGTETEPSKHCMCSCVCKREREQEWKKSLGWVVEPPSWPSIPDALVVEMSVGDDTELITADCVVIEVWIRYSHRWWCCVARTSWYMAVLGMGKRRS